MSHLSVDASHLFTASSYSCMWAVSPKKKKKTTKVFTSYSGLNNVTKTCKYVSGCWCVQDSSSVLWWWKMLHRTPCCLAQITFHSSWRHYIYSHLTKYSTRLRLVFFDLNLRWFNRSELGKLNIYSLTLTLCTSEVNHMAPLSWTSEEKDEFRIRHKARLLFVT